MKNLIAFWIIVRRFVLFQRFLEKELQDLLDKYVQDRKGLHFTRGKVLSVQLSNLYVVVACRISTALLILLISWNYTSLAALLRETLEHLNTNINYRKYSEFKKSISWATYILSLSIWALNLQFQCSPYTLCVTCLRWIIKLKLLKRAKSWATYNKSHSCIKIVRKIGEFVTESCSLYMPWQKSHILVLIVSIAAESKSFSEAAFRVLKINVLNWNYLRKAEIICNFFFANFGWSFPLRARCAAVIQRYFFFIVITLLLNMGHSNE